MRTKSRRTVLAICITIPLAACGSGTNTTTTPAANTTVESPPPTGSSPVNVTSATATNAPVTTFAVTTTTVAPDYTKSVLMTICGGTAVALSQIDTATGEATEIAYFDLAAQYGYTDLSTAACNSRDVWSADFTKVLLSGTPDGIEYKHSLLLDLQTGELTDLSTARMVTGFSSTNYDDYDARFLGEPGPKMTFGSDQVAVLTSNPDISILRVSVDDPSDFEMLADAPYGVIELPGHSEFHAGFIDRSVTNGGRYINPAGTFELYLNQGDIEMDTFSDKDTAFSQVDACDAGYIDWILGWVDQNTLAIWYEDNLHLVTFDGTTTACGEGVLPPNDRSPRSPVLSFDGQILFFQANDDTGNVANFEIPVTGGEPVPARDYNLHLDDGSGIWFPILG